jgi:hypothetical protein
MRKTLQALGRLKAGQMNKTETAYAQELELRKRYGEIAWYRFEGIKLRLADNTFYTPDFAVMLANGQLEMHEVKGFWTDDAGENQSRRRPVPIPDHRSNEAPGKAGGGWKVEEF